MLNSKQLKIFNDGRNVELVHIFLSGNGGTAKCNFVKIIYNTISKTVLYQCKNLKRPRVLLLGPTEISGVNTGSTTIYCGLEIKRGAKLFVFNDPFKAAIRNTFSNKFSEVKLLIIDELSMVSGDLWTDKNSRLGTSNR